MKRGNQFTIGLLYDTQIFALQINITFGSINSSTRGNTYEHTKVIHFFATTTI